MHPENWLRIELMSACVCNGEQPMASQCDLPLVYDPHMSTHEPASRGSLKLHWWGICACCYMAWPLYDHDLSIDAMARVGASGA